MLIGRDMMTVLLPEVFLWIVFPAWPATRSLKSPERSTTATLSERGNVPNFFRTMANRPAIFQTMIAHYEAIIATGLLSTKLKELLVVRTSQLNQCAYCLASHTALALKLGWSEEQIAAMPHAAKSGLFTPAEVAALHLAEKMTLDSNHYSDAEFAELRRFYSEEEVVEMLTAIGIFNYFNRFNNVLKMEPTQPLTPEEIAAGGFHTP